MKTVLTKFLAISSIALLMLSSCKKDETRVVASPGKVGALQASSTNVVLSKATLSSTAVTFNWSAATFGYKAAVTYILQIDVKGDNFATPKEFTMGSTAVTQSFSTPDFNALLLGMHLPTGVSSAVEARLKAQLSATSTPAYSNVLSLNVTPFALISYAYVPGSYEGWNNPGPQEDSLVSAKGDGIYVGVINFTSGNRDFLIVPVKGKWDNKWATTDAQGTGSTTANYSTEYVTTGGNNFFAPTTAGKYLVTFNSNTGSLSMVQANSYSVIGSSTPGTAWSTDTDLKYVNGDQAWEGVIPMTAGEFKIRQNHDWGNSWGIPQAGTEGDGVPATLNNTKNNNIPITTAGNYLVSFGIPLTAMGTGPSVTATYAVTKQ